MPDLVSLQEFVDGASIDAEVAVLRPDYQVLVLAVAGIMPGPGDEASERLLLAAEASAREALAAAQVDQLPHIAAWRDAYRGFGAKPQRTRNSAEALLRRAAAAGLPRVNRLTDIYNAVSVLHQIPVGGEDLTCYVGPPRLVRATGQEPFDTAVDGEIVIEHPEPGEVVWRDQAGVTCRRWNWRQARRTQLRDETTAVVFILDALAPMTDGNLSAAGEDLLTHLDRLGPELTAAQRLLAATPTMTSTTPEGV
jgi:DNA/RNA-binding domain of Phe-tRNA-synthetase-like protein